MNSHVTSVLAGCEQHAFDDPEPVCVVAGELDGDAASAEDPARQHAAQPAQAVRGGADGPPGQVLPRRHARQHQRGPTRRDVQPVRGARSVFL